MTLTQNWVGYLDRSYEQIKKSCLSRLGVLAPEISDHSETNPLIIILSMFAGVGEMLNLYIDSWARESFIGTARRFSSVVRLTRLIDYNVRARNPSSVNLKFTLIDDDGVPTNLSSGTLNIPLGTIINSLNGAIPFVLNQNVVITAGNSNVFGFASQYSNITGDILGTTNGQSNQSVPLVDNYVDGSLKITINGEEWKLYRSFGTMFSTTKGFIINIDEDSKAYVEFGDGLNGVIPTIGFTIFGDYKTCQGTAGNIPPNQITQLITTVPGVPVGLTLSVTNPDYASGGTNFETLDDIKNRAPRSIRTLERAVTYQDYLDLCYLVLGVGAAEISYCCGKFVDIYIAPNSPGAATQSLLQSVTDYINCRKMITTQISVKAAGISKIWIKATIKGKPVLSEAEIYAEVVNKLDEEFGYSKLQINRRISITAIIATLESLPTVDSLVIEQVRIQPFPRPINNTTNPLNLTFNSLPIGTSPFKYTIRWNQSISKFVILKGTFSVGEFSVGATYADSIVSFTLNAGTYLNNDTWEFTAFPSYPEIFPQNIIEIADFSAAIVEVGPFIDEDIPRTIFSDLTIQTQAAYTNCLPPC